MFLEIDSANKRRWPAILQKFIAYFCPTFSATVKKDNAEGHAMTKATLPPAGGRVIHFTFRVGLRLLWQTLDSLLGNDHRIQFYRIIDHR